MPLWLPIVGTVLLGLFGGAGATLLWELWLKPRRERRNIARVMLAENSHNLRIMAAASLKAQGQDAAGGPQSIGEDFQLSTLAFDALAPDIGELPAQIVREVVFLRSYYGSLNAMPASFGARLDQAYGARASEDVLRAHAQLSNRVAIFRHTLDAAIQRIGLVQPLLAKVAYSRWTREGRAERRGMQLNIDELRATMIKNEATRQEY